MGNKKTGLISKALVVVLALSLPVLFSAANAWMVIEKHEVNLAGKQARVHVMRNHQVEYKHVGGIFGARIHREKGGLVVTRVFGAPRRGAFQTTKPATAAEKALYHKFYPD